MEAAGNWTILQKLSPKKAAFLKCTLAAFKEISLPRQKGHG
jgi:hypothetical protein